jgi:hypothetical protein
VVRVDDDEVLLLGTAGKRVVLERLEGARRGVRDMAGSARIRRVCGEEGMSRFERAVLLELLLEPPSPAVAASKAA